MNKDNNFKKKKSANQGSGAQNNTSKIRTVAKEISQSSDNEQPQAQENIHIESPPGNEILLELLAKIKKVDFRKLAGLTEGDEAISDKHYLVCTVEHVLELAKRNKWGICQNHDSIFIYNGGYWKLVESEEVKTFLGMAAEKMGVSRNNARFFRFRDLLYKQFLSTANLPKPKIDKNMVYINLLNGTYEFTPDGGKLRDFKMEDFLTYQLPFEYNLASTAPLFEKYLAKVLPEAELQKIMAEFLGYVFTRNLKLEKTLLLYGDGANGKSVMHDVIHSLLGSTNVTSYSIQGLTDDKGYQRARIENVLVNYASEIQGRLQSSFFKMLVSGESVEARNPYGQPFTMEHYAKLIFNCNELPVDIEHNRGFYRRFLIVPFNVTIPEDEQDKSLAEKISSSELSGVFNWVLAGLTRLLLQGKFTQSDLVDEQLEQYATQSDSVKLFMEENVYKRSIDKHVSLKELFSEFIRYCKNAELPICSRVVFSRRLRRDKYVIVRKNIGNVVMVEKTINRIASLATFSTRE